MKKITFLLFVSLAAFTIKMQAQAITFDSTNAPVAGSVWRQATDTFAKSITVTAGGSNVTWNYDTAFHPTDTIITRFASKTGTVYSSTYPKSTLVFTSNLDSSIAYTHPTKHGFFIDGIGINTSSIQDTLKYAPSDLFMPFGITYMDSVKNTAHTSASFSFLSITLSSSSYTYRNFKVDGYGTVITPAGTYAHVLRIVSTITQTDSSTIDSSGTKRLLNASVSKAYEYMWVQNDPKQPIVLDIRCDGSNVVRSGTYTYIDRTSTNNILPISAQPLVYPNPANNTVKIKPQSAYTNYSAELINVLGQRVWTGMELTGNTYIPASNIPNGSYICRVAQDGKVYTQPIVIKH